MSLNQIEYVDRLLPWYGCRGVEDTDSLFNKSTIADWDRLQSHLNTEMITLGRMFPTKSLNLQRFSSVSFSTPRRGQLYCVVY